MHRIAVIVSAVFHPMIMPLACVYTACYFDWFLNGLMSEDQVRAVLFIVALSTIAFPGLNILLLRWYGVITSLETPKKKERTAPFISSIFFFSLGYYMLRKGLVPEVIYSIILGCIITLLILTLLNFKWKVSAHTAGAFGLIGTTLALFDLHDFGNIALLSAVFLIGGTVMSARLLLRVHSPAQVYLGAFVGFFCLYLPVISGLVI